MTDLALSRRALTRSLVVLPAIAAPAAVSAATGLSRSPIRSFDIALAKYRHARAEFERIIELYEDAGKIAGTVSDEAFAAMLAAPTENVADISVKLETYIFEYDGSEMDCERLALIAQDARRLAGRA